MVPWNSNSGGVAYIWQSKWVGIIPIKAEGTQIDFLSDILVTVASLDLKVPILFTGDVTRDDSQQRFLAQHSITALLRHCFKWLQHCSNIATLCCAENRSLRTVSCNITLKRTGSAPCKGIQYSLGFWIPRSGSRIPGTGFQSVSVELGFWIQIFIRIPGSRYWIPDFLSVELGFRISVVSMILQSQDS